MSTILFWIAAGLMITSFALRFVPRSKYWPTALYSTSLLLIAASVAIDAKSSIAEKYVATSLLIAIAGFLAFGEWLRWCHNNDKCMTCTIFRKVHGMEEPDGVTEVREGQDDGELPEGAPDRT